MNHKPLLESSIIVRTYIMYIYTYYIVYSSFYTRMFAGSWDWVQAPLAKGYGICEVPILQFDRISVSLKGNLTHVGMEAKGSIVYLTAFEHRFLIIFLDLSFPCNLFSAWTSFGHPTYLYMVIFDMTANRQYPAMSLTPMRGYESILRTALGSILGARCNWAEPNCARRLSTELGPVSLAKLNHVDSSQVVMLYTIYVHHTNT